MDIKQIKNSCNFVFSRNPIFITSQYPSAAFDASGGLYTITMSGNDIFNGRFFPPLHLEISEIVNAAVQFFPEPQEYGNSPLYLIEDIEEMSSRKAIITSEYDSLPDESSIVVIPGGVSKQNYRRLVAADTDAFAARFLRPDCNFFLTTRTESWRLSMKETELYPLCFFASPQVDEIVINTVDGSFSEVFDRLEPGLYALDINNLRQQFMDDHDCMPSIFDIYMAGVFSCRIVVERANISRERCRLKFRNSLGVFEIIELTGEMTITPEYDDAEETTFKRFDPITADYYAERERTERRQSVTVETGVKRPDELNFLMDMISSEEVYLMDLAAHPVKVIPSVEEFTYKPHPDKPQNFTIKLTSVEGETNIMSEIVYGDDSKKPRVFANPFSKQFD